MQHAGLVEGLGMAIGYNDFTAMLRRAAELVTANQRLLSELDSHGGDGDHGPTMARAMAQVEKAVTEAAGEDWKALCTAVAWGIMGVDGGSTGPLFGSLFLGMAAACEGKDTLDTAALAALFEAGLAGVRKRTKAAPGDKTMMDALVPAVTALGEAAQAGLSPEEALARAAAAARAGAESTVEMQAKFGRARNLGEGSVGSQDPGATSVAFLFEGFAEGVRDHA